ncbi:hypothetical protein, unlikely [Trypanosoma congolense IL3000]|uniref:Uncharacterized protein n=1 Tax=Trypanosoma congolense (strain IL3000) TaxID=1068625 RepID=F9W7L4_TRYCI|nr:hypothetical protein, unlikely [Trypanosoma congolense IL3000]
MRMWLYLRRCINPAPFGRVVPGAIHAQRRFVCLCVRWWTPVLMWLCFPTRCAHRVLFHASLRLWLLHCRSFLILSELFPLSFGTRNFFYLVLGYILDLSELSGGYRHHSNNICPLIISFSPFVGLFSGSARCR